MHTNKHHAVLLEYLPHFAGCPGLSVRSGHHPVLSGFRQSQPAVARRAPTCKDPMPIVSVKPTKNPPRPEGQREKKGPKRQTRGGGRAGGTAVSFKEYHAMLHWPTWRLWAMFRPKQPRPGDIVSSDFFSIANSSSWQYRKFVNWTKEHTKKHKVPWFRGYSLKNSRNQKQSTTPNFDV